jgi:beta-phosphoglucomutase-like phosphatase (HAD superfamily)
MSASALPADPAVVEVILCDADGCLFDSEPIAFAASAPVTNDLLQAFGAAGEYTGEELRRHTTGKNFRTTAGELATRFGLELSPRELQRWVARERDAVTAALSDALRPDPEVGEPLSALAGRYRLAVVSSSARSRVDACLGSAGLGGFFADTDIFSAEDSLSRPQSKPAPAIYEHAVERLGVDPGAALAVEDSVSGVQSAVAAGVGTVGLLQYVPRDELAGRADALIAAGAGVVVASWGDLVELLR